jgi:hypothetical protein
VGTDEQPDAPKRTEPKYLPNSFKAQMAKQQKERNRNPILIRNNSGTGLQTKPASVNSTATARGVFKTQRNSSVSGLKEKVMA